jgi:transcriptional repressor NF-X1
LTIDDIDRAVGAVLAAGTGLKFTTNFLLSDEIVIEALSSPAYTLQSTEAKLKSYKLPLAQTVSRLGLAKGVSLCHVDPSLSITRREGDTSLTGAGGWNAVASHGSWRKTSQPAAAPTTMAPRSLVALKRSDWRKKGKEILMAPVEDDWLEAAEKLEESGAEDQNGEDGKENQGNPASKDEEEQNGQGASQGQAIAQDDEESNVAQGEWDGQVDGQEPATPRDGEDNSITQEA